MSDPVKPPPGARAPQQEAEEDSGATVTLSRYAAPQPALPFAGGPGPAAPSPAVPVASAFPAPAPAPWAPPPSTPGPTPASPWAQRAPMPRGLASDPAPRAQPSTSVASNADVGAWSGGQSPPAFVSPPLAPTSGVGRATSEPLRHSSTAAHAGLAAASDAAADRAQSMSMRTATRRTESGVRLLWHDEDSVLRIRRQPEWKALLARRERRAPERSNAYGSPEAEDASEMAAILLDGQPSSESAVADALAVGFGEDGQFEPELRRVDGELVLELDDATLLESLVSIATATASGDENLRRVLDVANAFLAVPGKAGPGAMARGLADRVREVWRAGKERPFDVAKLDELASRAVLEQRAYRKKDVLGGVHARASLLLAASTTSVPFYLPEAATKKLPLYMRVPVRAVVEVHPREDETEAHGWSLRALVLGRVLDPRA